MDPGRHTRLWRRDGAGRWRHRWRRVHHRITHNGDFEAFAGFGLLLDVGSTLAYWLEEALEQPAPAVVDSSRIAGMMDLMICQGDWFAAVRWGFLCTLAPFPNTPAARDLERWTTLFEAAFGDLLQTDPRLEDLTEPKSRRLLTALQSEPELEALGEDDLRRWIGSTIHSFLCNDPATAMRQFMEGARGSFGLVVVSTTWPDQARQDPPSSSCPIRPIRCASIRTCCSSWPGPRGIGARCGLVVNPSTESRTIAAGL